MDLTDADKRAVLGAEIKLWTRTRYLAEIRARAGKRAGDQEYAARGMEELERAEKVLDQLQAEEKLTNGSESNGIPLGDSAG